MKLNKSNSIIFDLEESIYESPQAKLSYLICIQLLFHCLSSLETEKGLLGERERETVFVNHDRDNR